MLMWAFFVLATQPSGLDSIFPLQNLHGCQGPPKPKELYYHNCPQSLASKAHKMDVMAQNFPTRWRVIWFLVKGGLTWSLLACEKVKPQSWSHFLIAVLPRRFAWPFWGNFACSIFPHFLVLFLSVYFPILFIYGILRIHCVSYVMPCAYFIIYVFWIHLILPSWCTSMVKKVCCRFVVSKSCPKLYPFPCLHHYSKVVTVNYAIG